MLSIHCIDDTLATVQPVDSFDLRKTLLSGQVFNYKQVTNGVYLVQHQDKATLTAQGGRGELLLAATPEDIEQVWIPYFDLETDYDSKLKALNLDPFADVCCHVSKGIHILRQDPWEMCISYIISQRNKIEHISGIVQKLCQNHGTHLAEQEEYLCVPNLYAFPTVSQLASCSLEDLRACSVGFRDSYIQGFASFVQDNPSVLEDWKSLPHNQLIIELMKHQGIGPKVANCISLFGYHNLEAFPIDLWIQRIISGVYKNNLNPQASFGDMAGVIQQYMFNYVRNYGGNYNV